MHWFALLMQNILKNGSPTLDGNVHFTIFERFLPVLQLIYCTTTLLMLSYAYKVSTEESKTKFISYSYLLFISICLLMTFISEVFLSILGVTKNSSISFLFLSLFSFNVVNFIHLFPRYWNRFIIINKQQRCVSSKRCW